MENQLNLYFIDELKVKGIKYKGFGIIPKAVMQDRELTLEAKAIYSYFCSFAGKKSTVFPTVGKITSDLNIAKSTYYKHFKLLQLKKYISIRKEKARKGHFSHNIYTLLAPKEKGYGTIPKALMTDDRLDIKAKGIYAYFSCLFGSSDKAFPSRKKIFFDLKLSETTYHKYFKLLIECNYIRAEQRHENGKLSINDYYLVKAPNPVNVVRRIIAVIKHTIQKVTKFKAQTQKQALKNIDKFELLNKDMFEISINRFKTVIRKSNIDITELSQESMKALVERFDDLSMSIDHWYSYIKQMILREIAVPTEYKSLV